VVRSTAVHRQDKLHFPFHFICSVKSLFILCGSFPLLSTETINAIEKGDYNPTINLCIAICKALDKTLDELFWEE